MKNMEVYFLQHVWGRIMEMTESNREKQNTNCFGKKLDTNKLQSNLLNQHWAPFLPYRVLFCSMFGDIS